MLKESNKNIYTEEKEKYLEQNKSLKMAETFGIWIILFLQ